MLAKFVNRQIKFAGGKILEHDGNVTVNPRDEDFIAVGYKPVEEHRLEEKEGYYQVPEYSEDDEYIYINYHYEEIPDEQEADA